LKNSIAAACAPFEGLDGGIDQSALHRWRNKQYRKNISEAAEDKIEAKSESEITLTPTNRTKVLLLTDAFLPHAGGSREYYYNIYSKLVDLGDSEVRLLTKKIDGWEEFDRSVCSEHFRIVRRFKRLPSWKVQELPKGLGPFLQASWHVLRYRPAIAHAGDLFPPGITAMALKKLLGLPYVVYCHGEEIPQLDRYKYQPKVRNRIYLNADAVIAASEFTRNNLIKLGVPSERVCKIVPGVDSARFCPMPRRADLVERYRLQGKIVVLTVARLVPRKGHRIAVEAFSKICHEVPNAHYLIVGTGPEEARLRQMVSEAGLNERVTFAGYVPAEQLPDIYNLCDVMVMPNRQESDGDVEGFGIVFLEANAAGKPVIGGRSGGAIEAIAEGRTGYLVNPEDSNELAMVLRRLLIDRNLREELGQEGKRRVRTEFSWASRAALLRALNRKILRLDVEDGGSRCTTAEAGGLRDRTALHRQSGLSKQQEPQSEAKENNGESVGMATGPQQGI
jgi:phosphatidyl-myo-inositol dimannoside synthase